MLATILVLMLEAQYPQPEPETCNTPAVLMVFKWAKECPTHTLRFDFRDDDTFRVVCVPQRKLPKKEAGK